MGLKQNTILLAKIETTYGTDPTPTGAANAILINDDFSLNPINANQLTRNTLDGSMGTKGTLVAGKHCTLTCTVELAGAGSAAVTAGTAPSYGVLLRAAGFDETITATTDTQYVPVSTGHESATLYVHRDGVLHKITGARATVSFNLSATAIPTATFNFIGLYNDPTDTANPTPTYTGFQKPLEVSEANTPTLTIDSYSAKTESISIDMGAQVEYTNLINEESVKYLDRAITGSINFEEPTVATKNFYTMTKNGSEVALQLIHGNSTGEIVQFDASQTQVSSLSHSEISGSNSIQAELSFNKSSGDDEITITVK